MPILTAAQMLEVQMIQNSQNSQLFWWPPGRANQKREFPMRITTLRSSGREMTLHDITTLGTPGPDPLTEVGGREFMPSILQPPGQLTLVGFFNASVVFPREKRVFLVMWPLVPGFLFRARWMGAGYVLNPGDMEAVIDTPMSTTVTIQFSGKVLIIPAKRR